MAQTLLFEKPFYIDNAGGVGKNVCVVQGAANGTCKLPTAQNAAGFLGVTIESQPNQNRGVGVCRLGVFNMLAGGTIARGDRVGINSAAGDVRSVEALIIASPMGNAVIHVVGRAEVAAVSGDLFPVMIQDYTVNGA